ncbi:alanine--glyoxylate aminotransferase family protein [Desulfovibrio sp. OttesenSCG-928-G15]|nr:alanine--glyoxylate aminotransferase family protein [Desulfovibrio sp. OttesenSCG-928-G15]
MLTKQRLLTPGPTPLPERVRLAMAQDMIHHRKPAFKALMAETRAGLAELFGTSEAVLPLCCSGTGAMVAAVTNLFSPGEKVLVVEGGKFAERWTEICHTHGVKTTVLPVEWGKAADPALVAAELDKDASLVGVLVQHSETSTGVQHPVGALGAITRNRPVLLVVDGISAVSITPCPMDAWGIDCLVTGSQKGLMLPPGLALISLSERAWTKARAVTSGFYFNLLKEKENNSKGQSAFTSPVSLIVGLAESLRMFSETGFDSVYRKQWAMTLMTRKGLEAMGLTLFVPENFAWGLTSVLLPQGIDAVRLLAHAAEHYGVVMAAGQDHLKNRMVRFGHMGWVDYGDITAGLYAFACSYTALGGHIGCRDYLEQALAAYWTALDEGCPKAY